MIKIILIGIGVLVLIMFAFVAFKMQQASQVRFVDTALGTGSLFEHAARYAPSFRIFDNSENYMVVTLTGPEKFISGLHDKFTFTEVAQQKTEILFNMFTTISPSINHNTLTDTWYYTEGISLSGNQKYEIVMGKNTRSVLLVIWYPDNAGTIMQQ